MLSIIVNICLQTKTGIIWPVNYTICSPRGVVISDLSISNHLSEEERSGPEVIKLFPCSSQLRTKLILLINVKMPTIFGILTFISMINTTSGRLKARHIIICRYFRLYEQLKFRVELS